MVTEIEVEANFDVDEILVVVEIEVDDDEVLSYAELTSTAFPLTIRKPLPASQQSVPLIPSPQQ